jgi:mevalonate kinase
VTGAADLVVSAPGKAFLIGEYLVLEGGPAVVTAVNRRAVARTGPPGQASPLLTRATERALAAVGGASCDAVDVDTGRFHERDAKLGLGSSAATAVAAVGLVFARHGLDPAAQRARICEVADEAHRAAQGGQGSGADVAAAAYGGTLLFRRQPDGRRDCAPLELPDDLRLVYVWTGAPVSTAAMVGRARRFARADAGAYRGVIDDLDGAAWSFVTALQVGDLAAAIESVKRYGQAMRRLGDQMATSIVTPPLAAIAALAEELGGAAKPSGAGGGDIGIAFFADGRAAQEFVRRLDERLRVLDLRTDHDGIALEPPPRETRRRSQ